MGHQGKEKADPKYFMKVDELDILLGKQQFF